MPTVIPLDAFERVQARLAANNPRVTPPRVANGPTLLTGLAICATCGAGMTRTGTRRRQRNYSYYSCAGCQQRGKSVCRGRHMPMEKLDDLVVANVKEQLFAPDRLAVILETLVERQGAKEQAVLDRRAALEGELNAKQGKLSRLYRAIEEGVVEIDDELRERIKSLKTERDIAQTSLDRIASQISARAAITPERIDAFAKLVREKIDGADIQARKSYLRSVISYVEVDDDKVRIVGDKATLAGVIAGQQIQADNVRGFVRKWRAQGESNPCFRRERATSWTARRWALTEAPAWRRRGRAIVASLRSGKARFRAEISPRLGRAPCAAARAARNHRRLSGGLSMRAIRIHQTGGPEVMQFEEVELAPPGPGQARVRHHAIGVNYLDIYYRTGFYPSPCAALHPRQRGRRRGRRGRQGRQGFQARRPRRLCHDDRLLRRGAQCRGQAPRQTAARDLLRHRRGDDAQGPDGAISAAPDLQGARGRHDPGPCRGGRRRADPLPMGQGAGRDRHRHRRLRGEGARSPRKRAPSTSSSTGRRISPRASARSPRAANAMSSMTASARRPFPPRSTACRPFGMFASYGSASGGIEAFNLGLLGQKGSLFATRPTLFTFLADRDAAREDGARSVQGRRLGRGEGAGHRARAARRGRADPRRARRPAKRRPRSC